MGTQTPNPATECANLGLKTAAHEKKGVDLHMYLSATGAHVELSNFHVDLYVRLVLNPPTIDNYPPPVLGCLFTHPTLNHAGPSLTI